MYIKLKISTISSTSISPANIVDKHSLYHTTHTTIDILTGPILVVHPEGPAQLLLRVSAARHVGRDHELLEVDAAVPVLVENTEQLLQKLVASLALCR